MATQQKFDYVTFQTTFSDIKQKAAEVKYIDDALEYLREVDSRAYDPDHQESLGDNAGPINPVTYELGTTAPVFYQVYFIALDNSDKEEADRRLEEISNESAEWAYRVLPPLLYDCDPLVKPVPSDFRSAIDALTGGGSIESTIDTEVPTTNLGNFGQSIGDWEGSAATSFDRNFVAPFTNVRANQRMAVARLSACLVAAKAVVECGQHSLMNAVVTIDEALDEQLEKRQDTMHPALITQETAIFLSEKLGLIGELASFAGKRGESVAEVLGYVSDGLEFASDYLPTDAEQSKDVEMTTAEDVVDVLDGLFSDTRTNASGQWDELRPSVQDLVRDVNKDERQELLYPPESGLRGVPPGDFHHESSTQYD